MKISDYFLGLCMSTKKSSEERKKGSSFDCYNESYCDELDKNLSIIPFHNDIEYYADYKVQILQKICPDVHSILEFGCGVGRNIRYLQKYFRSSSITGTDISDTCLQEARISYPDVAFLPPNEIYTHTYDLILIADVIHHIHPSERLGYFVSLNKLLADNGSIIIFEQNPYNPITRYLVRTCPFDVDASLLTDSEVKKILKCSGYEVLSRSYCFFFPSALKKCNNFEKRIGFLPFGGKYYIHARKDK